MPMRKSIHLKWVFIVLILVLVACGQTGPSQSPGESAGPTQVHHEIVPVDLPADQSGHATDFDSSISAQAKEAIGGDRFTFGQFERPFNANTMDTYFPYLDIEDTSVFQDDTWIFATITVKSPDANGKLPGKYAAELDLDVDGKGDWLVIASSPSTTDWSTDGVKIFEDANHDVGGEVAMFTDKHPQTGDGFEKLVFDQGKGDDPDAAWARVLPDDAKTVQLAIKRAVLGNDPSYMIGMWAGTASLDPALFDINDHFTHTQAGAANKGYDVYYPIKAVAELDNSCRMAVGFKPTGTEPGLCDTQKPTTGIGTKCTYTFAEAAACIQDPNWKWDQKTCTCTYVGPK